LLAIAGFRYYPRIMTENKDIEAAMPDLRDATFHIEAHELDANGIHAYVMFPNGYGASIINTKFSYGVEVAVMHGENQNYETAEIETETDIAPDDGVIGYIEGVEALNAILIRIANLPTRSKKIEE
jgi:hypothetical protein